MYWTIKVNCGGLKKTFGQSSPDGATKEEVTKKFEAMMERKWPDGTRMIPKGKIVSVEPRDMSKPLPEFKDANGNSHVAGSFT